MYGVSSGAPSSSGRPRESRPVKWVSSARPASAAASGEDSPRAQLQQRVIESRSEADVLETHRDETVERIAELQQQVLESGDAGAGDRLAAYERWLAMEEPTWAAVNYAPVDYQDLYYYAAPKTRATTWPASTPTCSPPARC